ncbi:YcgL domain-containing protein [Pistricoccus aurantiacus]|uniref:YcgL domain-containing protein n=1 Tax=Pistricoccus aurantiacus TaxID=1883414 RepID=UPI003628BC27
MTSLRDGKLLCEVFKSSRKDEMYLYVDKQRGLVDVPEALLASFGTPQAVMTLVLTPQKPLARVETTAVIEAIKEKGFYLQMPPPKEDYLLDAYRTPTESRY